MTNLHDNEIPFGKSYEQIILEYFGELSIPICFNFPSGHLNDNRAIKLGCRADLEITWWSSFSNGIYSKFYST